MTVHSLKIFLPDEAATLACGSNLAHAMMQHAGIIFLRGQLGAGKTTFSRGFLRGMGHQGAVKSPTYALVEPYDFGQFHVYHFDFYRVQDPLELEYMGVRDYFTAQSICLIEWPEQAGSVIPSSDIECHLTLLSGGREIEFQAHSVYGQQLIKKLTQD